MGHLVERGARSNLQPVAGAPAVSTGVIGVSSNDRAGSGVAGAPVAAGSATAASAVAGLVCGAVRD